MTTSTLEWPEQPATKPKTRHRLLPATKPTLRLRLLYPALVVAAISVTLFSLLGIATMTGILPSAHSSAPAAGREKLAPTAQATKVAPKSAAAKAIAATAACVGCGTVQSVNSVEVPAKTTGVGAVAGGLTGAVLGNQVGHGGGRAVMTIAGGAGGAYLGNKIEESTRRSTAYKIVVRMEDGTQRTIYQAEPPNVVIGGPVQVVGNTVVARS